MSSPYAPHSYEERVGALLIRVRVSSDLNQDTLMIRIASRADVETDQQESAMFTTEREAIAWIRRWLRGVATPQ